MFNLCFDDSFCAGVFCIACSAYFLEQKDFYLHIFYLMVVWEPLFIGARAFLLVTPFCVFLLHYTPGLVPIFHCKVLFYFAISHLRGCLEKKHVLSIEGGLVGYHN